MLALLNYSTEVRDGTIYLVSHWNTDIGRISSATALIPELSDEETLEVVRLQVKEHVERQLRLGNPMGDGTELEPQRV